MPEKAEIKQRGEGSRADHLRCVMCMICDNTMFDAAYMNSLTNALRLII